MFNNAIPMQTNAPNKASASDVGIIFLMAMGLIIGIPMIAVLLSRCVACCRASRHVNSNTLFAPSEAARITVSLSGEDISSPYGGV